MSEYMPDVKSIPIKVRHHDQPVFIAAYVENDKSSNAIC